MFSLCIIFSKEILYTILYLSAQSSDLLEDCHKLLERFKYPYEMMPLVYAVLKDSSDIEEASRRIDEGIQNLKLNLKNGFLHLNLFLNNLNSMCLQLCKVLL